MRFHASFASCFLFLTIASVFTLAFIMHQDQQEQGLVSRSLFAVPASSGAHGPIVIDGNSQLDAFCASNGTSGTGWSTAHVIKDYAIDATGLASGIVIQDTTRYLILKNITVSNANTHLYDCGIVLKNVTHVNITSCLIHACATGIAVNASSLVIVTRNTVTSSTNGISLQSGSHDLTSTHNRVSGCGDNGYYLNLVDNSTFVNNTATSNFYGISISQADGNTFENNTASSSTRNGIQLGMSTNYNKFINNTCVSNSMDGFSLYATYHDQFINNTLHGNGNGIYLASSGDNEFIGNQAHSNGMGIQLYNSQLNNFTDNDVSSNAFGIFLHTYSWNNRIIDNIASSCTQEGFHLQDSDSNVLENNTANSNSLNGFFLSLSNFCNLTRNTGCNDINASIVLDRTLNVSLVMNNASHDFIGIYLYRANYTDCTQNFVSSNHQGIVLTTGSSGNKIYVNAIWSNSLNQAVDNGTSNLFDDGILGNKWGDYLTRYPSATETNSIGSVPYAINGSAGTFDRYPFLPLQNYLTILYPGNISYEYSRTGHHIVWSVSDSIYLDPRYTVAQDGAVLIDNGKWYATENIDVPVDGNTVGTHVYSIVVTDGLGEIVKDNVTVTVYNLAPSITGSADSTFTAGDMGHVISWQLEDNSVLGPIYTVYRNGTPVIINQSWTPGVPIQVSVSSLGAGSYNFTIIAEDGLGGSATNEVIVTVKPNNSGNGGGHGPGGNNTIDGFPIVILGIGIVASMVLRIARNLRKMRED